MAPAVAVGVLAVGVAVLSLGVAAPAVGEQEPCQPHAVGSCAPTNRFMSELDWSRLSRRDQVGTSFIHWGNAHTSRERLDYGP